MYVLFILQVVFKLMHDAVEWQDLREQIDTLQEKVQRLKRTVKVYAKRLKASEGQ